MLKDSKDWYMMSRPLFNSGYEDDEFLAYGRDGFLELLDSVLGCDVLLYDKTINRKPQKIRAIIQNRTSDTQTNATVRQILCPIGTLHCGQYIQDDVGYWLVSALPDNNRIYEKAVLWKCRYTIRFRSPIHRQIVDYPIYVENSTQYGSGLTEKENLTVGGAQYLAYVPYNRETILLDSGFRFIMDRNREHPTVYRITQVDPETYAVGSENEDGLISWSLEETQFNEETDSRAEMVADYDRYIPGGSASHPHTGNRVLLMDLDGDYNLSIGERKKIRVMCRENGEDCTDTCGYTLEYDLCDGAAEVESVEDHVITLYAPQDRRSIGQTIWIRAACESLDSEAAIKIKIVNF